MIIKTDGIFRKNRKVPFKYKNLIFNRLMSEVIDLLVLGKNTQPFDMPEM